MRWLYTRAIQSLIAQDLKQLQGTQAAQWWGGGGGGEVF